MIMRMRMRMIVAVVKSVAHVTAIRGRERKSWGRRGLTAATTPRIT